MDFTQKINYVRKSGIGVPRILTIDLSIAATDKVYDIAGNVFYILSAPESWSYIDVRFNESREAPIRLLQQVGLETPFYRLFITTPAGQTGTMTILYANEAPEFLRIIDNRSATNLDLQNIGVDIQAILLELQGRTDDAFAYDEVIIGLTSLCFWALPHQRHGCSLQAKSSNTGIIYIGFTEYVASNCWAVELQPGMSFTMDDYRGPIYAIADTANQRIGVAEW
jgi:hypothetical protein